MVAPTHKGDKNRHVHRWHQFGTTAAMSILKFIIVFVAAASVSHLAMSQQKTDTVRYVKTAQGYYMVLQEGDDVIRHLEQLMIAEKIPSAAVSGIGFVDIRFGFYKQRRKKFKVQHFRRMELASANGSMAWENNRPSVHLHGVVTGRNFKAFGGHILGATVGKGSVEIVVTVINHQLERRVEPRIGAPVLRLE